MNEILLDKDGYKKFLDELERLKEKNISLSSVASEAYSDAVGDGWHDNFAFEETMRESRKIACLIDNMINKHKNIKIIEEEVLDKDYINIGDIVKIEFIYEEDDREIEIVKLTGNYIPNTKSEITEITLNSPLGKRLYKSRVGDILEYNINNAVIKINVIEKC